MVYRIRVITIFLLCVHLILRVKSLTSEEPVSGSVRLTVYYLPMGIVAQNCIFPCLLPSIAYLPYIYETEAVSLVHGHSSMSALVHDSIWFAKALKIATVLTDHSLIGFADAPAIVCNKLLEGIFFRKNVLTRVEGQSVRFTIRKNLIYHYSKFCIFKL